jgi:hypothetical protein
MDESTVSHPQSNRKHSHSGNSKEAIEMHNEREIDDK